MQICSEEEGEGGKTQFYYFRLEHDQECIVKKVEGELSMKWSECVININIISRKVKFT